MSGMQLTIYHPAFVDLHDLFGQLRVKRQVQFVPQLCLFIEPEKFISTIIEPILKMVESVWKGPTKKAGVKFIQILLSTG